MKKTTRFLIATASLATVVGLSGVGLSYAHDRWSGGDGYRMHHGHGGHGGHAGMGRGGMMGQLAERYDANGDGALTQEEIDEGRKAQLAQYDTDQDGKLSLKEYEALWLDAMRSRMVDRFQHLDEDGDAEVTTDEFMAPLAQIVERHDRNDDGALSRDDHRRKHGWRDRDDDDRRPERD